MAKRRVKEEKQEIENIEVVSEEVTKEEPKKSRPKTKQYTLKKRMNISGKWREVGDKIGLTEEAYRYYHNKNIV